MRSRLALLFFLALGACRGGAGPVEPREQSCGGVLPDRPRDVEVVESWPLGTQLDHPRVPDASDVWPEMIARAEHTLDFAQFYASEAEGSDLEGSKLTAVLVRIEEAVKRGVRVRFLVDASFADKYPATLADLERRGVLVKKLDVGKLMGGVLHAKYFVVDGTEAFVGSQNFDWRALAHIQEIGVRVRGQHVALLAAVFADDWKSAGGTDEGSDAGALVYGDGTSDGALVTLAASPEGHLPPGAPWDLPMLVELLKNAKARLDVQLLTYGTKNRDGSAFTTLDDELRLAAARGVRVRLLVSHWAVKPGSASKASLEALARVPNVEVHVLTIPPVPGRDIPFARVAHAKYAVADGISTWVGTSNWEGDYFLKSRNVSVFVRGGKVARTLLEIFEGGWGEPYGAPLSAVPPMPGGPPSGSGPARR